MGQEGGLGHHRLPDELPDNTIATPEYYENPIGIDQIFGNEEYEIVSLSSGESISLLLYQKKLDTFFSNQVFDFNKKYNPLFVNIRNNSSIPEGTNIYIPNLESGFYRVSLFPETKDKRRSFNYSRWYNSIEVIGDSLKGNTFVLDPGHGGIDGGASVEKGSIRSFESAIVYDVTMRLIILLRQQGADITITHYSDARGPSNRDQIGQVPDYSSRYSDTQETWVLRYNPSVHTDIVINQERTIEHGPDETLKHRVGIANNVYSQLDDESRKKSYFLSLHVDHNLAVKKDLPISVLYSQGNDEFPGSNLIGKDFSEALAANINFNRVRGVAKGQRLLINSLANRIPNSVLIELGNMNNTDSSSLYRSVEGRNGFVYALYRGILETLPFESGNKPHFLDITTCKKLFSEKDMPKLLSHEDILRESTSELNPEGVIMPTYSSYSDFIASDFFKKYYDVGRSDIIPKSLYELIDSPRPDELSMKVQRMLLVLGYLELKDFHSERIHTEGLRDNEISYFGVLWKNDKEAIKKLQTDYEIGVDGIIGNDTKTVLHILIYHFLHSEERDQCRSKYKQMRDTLRVEGD